jgi:hypothetical protein
VILICNAAICKCYRDSVRSVAVAFAVAAGFAGAAAGSVAAVHAPVTATVVVRAYPLLCGNPRGALTFAFPASVDVPKKMPLGTVRVNGLAAAKVTVAGRTVTVVAPTQTGVTCQSIVLGRVTLLFVPGAGIGSAKAGTSAVTVHEGARRYKATLTVTR